MASAAVAECDKASPPVSPPVAALGAAAAGDVEASWPVEHPPKIRGKRLFCTGAHGCPPFFLLVPPLFVIGYGLGIVALVVVITVLAVFAVLIGLPVACGILSYTGLWRCPPFNWMGDTYLKMMYLGIQGAHDDFEAIGRNWQEVVSVKHFRPKKQLDKYRVDLSLQIEVPKEEEEEFNPKRSFGRQLGRDWGVTRFSKEHLYKFPQTDHFDTFAPGENPVSYVMKQLGHMYPRIHQDWPDKHSDESLTRLCLYGLGAHRLETTVEAGVRYYVIRTSALSGLPVRPGFARYGGDVYLDSSFRPVKIVDVGYGPGRRDGSEQVVVTRPGDQRWTEAKFRFRSSLSVLVTLVDHLYGVHLQVANLMVTAAREQLSPDHPMRRFLSPFMFQTIQVNSNARNNLVQPRSLAPRCFAFTEQGFQIAFAAAPKLLRCGFEVPASEGGPLLNFATYADYMKETHGIDTEWFRQGKRYYTILRTYLESFLGVFYANKQAVVDDPELHATLLQFTHQMELVTPKQELVDVPSDVDKKYEKIVDMVSSHMFWVSAMHEQVGAIEVFVQDVSFCAFKWVPGALIGTKQTATAQALLMASTSAPMPEILGTDWTHLFKDLSVPQRAGEKQSTPDECYRRLQSELQEMSDYCDQYNKTASARPFPECFPLVTMHPKLLEMSCSL